MSEECCANRQGKVGAEWHRRRGEDPCDLAREKRAAAFREKRRANAEAAGRTYVPNMAARDKQPRIGDWTPGSPILVPEHDPL